MSAARIRSQSMLQAAKRRVDSSVFGASLSNSPQTCSMNNSGSFSSPDDSSSDELSLSNGISPRAIKIEVC